MGKKNGMPCYLENFLRETWEKFTIYNFFYCTIFFKDNPFARPFRLSYLHELANLCVIIYHKIRDFPLSTLVQSNNTSIIFLIGNVLRDLVSFVQVKKREKHLRKSVIFSKVAGFTKSNTLPWLFFPFLNCINGTTSRNTSYIKI